MKAQKSNAAKLKCSQWLLTHPLSIKLYLLLQGQGWHQAECQGHLPATVAADVACAPGSPASCLSALTPEPPARQS